MSIMKALSNMFSTPIFNIQHLEHLTLASLRLWIEEKKYSEKSHQSLIKAVNKYYQNDCEYSGAPPINTGGVIGTHHKHIRESFRNFYDDWMGNGNIPSLFTSIVYVREYIDSERPVIIYDKVQNLLGMSSGDWARYIEFVGIDKAHVYINRLLQSVINFYEPKTKVDSEKDENPEFDPTIPRYVLETVNGYKEELTEIIDLYRNDPSLPIILHEVSKKFKDELTISGMLNESIGPDTKNWRVGTVRID